MKIDIFDVAFVTRLTSGAGATLTLKGFFVCSDLTFAPNLCVKTTKGITSGVKAAIRAEAARTFQLSWTLFGFDFVAESLKTSKRRAGAL